MTQAYKIVTAYSLLPVVSQWYDVMHGIRCQYLAPSHISIYIYTFIKLHCFISCRDPFITVIESLALFISKVFVIFLMSLLYATAAAAGRNPLAASAASLIYRHIFPQTKRHRPKSMPCFIFLLYRVSHILLPYYDRLCHANGVISFAVLRNLLAFSINELSHR